LRSCRGSARSVRRRIGPAFTLDAHSVGGEVANVTSTLRGRIGVTALPMLELLAINASRFGSPTGRQLSGRCQGVKAIYAWLYYRLQRGLVR